MILNTNGFIKSPCLIPFSTDFGAVISRFVACYLSRILVHLLLLQLSFNLFAYCRADRSRLSALVDLMLLPGQHSTYGPVYCVLLITDLRYYTNGNLQDLLILKPCCSSANISAVQYVCYHFCE